MHTYLLSDDSIRRYGNDFITRLEMLGELTPKLWITLGISGDKIARTITQNAPTSTALPERIIRVSFDRNTKDVIGNYIQLSPSLQLGQI